MNVLDENIVASQRALLRAWRIPVRQIGQEVGRAGLKDPDVIPMLRRLGGPTFFTRDLGFYERRLCPTGYCLICLGVGKDEVAVFVRRFLRQRAFATRAARMGTVVHASQSGLRWWDLDSAAEHISAWSASARRRGRKQ